jgi:hypothetical protein
VLPTNSTQTAKFRRYFLAGATGAAGSGSGNFFYPVATTPLLEGVTPAGNTISNQDYTATLSQYGDWVPITDVIEDTTPTTSCRTSPMCSVSQAAVTVETLRFNVLKAGVNVFYANAVAGRVFVVLRSVARRHRRVTTALNRQNAKKITSSWRLDAGLQHQVGRSGVHRPLPPRPGERHPQHHRLQAGRADYGPHTSPYEGEIGSIEQVRFLSSTVFAPFIDAGGAKGAIRSTGGTNADVYPILFFGRDAFGIVPLKGKSSMTPMVVNPKPAAGDPLAQRGSVGWKLWTATLILQEAFMARLEAGATA